MTEPSGITVPTGEINPAELGKARGQYSRKLILLFGLAAIGLYTGSNGAAFLLALQLQDLDPAQKVANLSAIAAAGALAGMIAGPLWGSLSDRIRSRWGRRNPLALFGTIFLAAALLFMAFSTTVLELGIALVVAQIAISSIIAPLGAIIPDRVPIRARGFASSVLGFGVLAGIVLGQTIGAVLSSINLVVAYGGLGLLIVVCLLLFILLNPDASSADAPKLGFSFRAFLRTFWVSPVKYPDFAWVFWGRGLIFLGYFAVSTYTLYILQDYIGLHKAKAVAYVPLLAVATFVGFLIAVFVAGWWSDKVGRRKPFVIGSSIICAVGVLIPFAVPTVPGMLLYAFVTGAGYAVFLSIDNALISQVLPPTGDTAKDLGVAGIGGAAASVIAPVVAGLIVSSTGLYQPLFIIAGAVSILGAVCILFVKQVR
jgi:MFS family permease